MAQFRIVLADGEPMTFDGARLVVDGMGTRVLDADGDTVAAFTGGVVSAYRLPDAPADDEE